LRLTYSFTSSDDVATGEPFRRRSSLQHRVTFYLDSGDDGISDDDRRQTSLVVGDLVARGGLELGLDVFYYLDRGGQHNEKYWGARFHLPMLYLYGEEGVLPPPEWAGRTKLRRSWILERGTVSHRNE
jgi:hypothetical protein